MFLKVLRSSPSFASSVAQRTAVAKELRSSGGAAKVVSCLVHPMSTTVGSTNTNPAAAYAILSTQIANMQRLHSSTTTSKAPAEVLLQKKLELVLEIESQLLDLAEHTTTKQDVVYNNIGMTTAGDLDTLFKDSHLKRDTISGKVSELKQLIEEAKTLYSGLEESTKSE